MVTLTAFYTLWYILTLIAIFFYLYCFQIPTNAFFLSNTEFFNAINTYTNRGFLLKLLILQLSGLPPFCFFFIKVGLLTEVSYTSNLFILVLIFLNFFLSTIFYLRIFTVTNHQLSNNTLKLLATSCIIQSTSTSRFSHKFNFTYGTYAFLTLNIFSALFFMEYFSLITVFQ